MWAHVGEWTSIHISQTLEEGKYIYRITIGGEEVHAVENSEPEEFSDVKVYASDPWHNAQPGSIRNLVIKSRYQGESTPVWVSGSILEANDLMSYLMSYQITLLSLIPSFSYNKTFLFGTSR